MLLILITEALNFVPTHSSPGSAQESENDVSMGPKTDSSIWKREGSTFTTVFWSTALSAPPHLTHLTTPSLGGTITSDPLKHPD